MKGHLSIDGEGLASGCEFDASLRADRLPPAAGGQGAFPARQLNCLGLAHPVLWSFVPGDSISSMTRLLHRLSYLLITILLQCAVGICVLAGPQQSTEIIPLSDVRAGMEGYAYTIFAGDEIEKFDLVVIGVMPNFLGPKQSIILVELKGPKVEHTGVVAGMSGSPVYLDGKLAGALSLKLGIFTKEAIAGVTPIEDVLRPPTQSAELQTAPQQFALPNDADAHTSLPSGASLEGIETPLVFSG